MDNGIKIHIQRYIDECNLLLSILSDAKPKTSIKTEVGNNLIASGLGALADDFARDLFGTGGGFYGITKRATMKHLKEQERQQHQSKVQAHQNSFNNLFIEIKSFLVTVSIQRSGLTSAGNSHLLVKRLASVQSLSRLESRIRKLSAVLHGIQAEPLIYNKDIPSYLSELNNSRDNQLKNDVQERQAAAQVAVVSTIGNDILICQLLQPGRNWSGLI